LYSPETILGFTGRLELLVGMRLHSLIYAANQCVPLIGLVYEPKVKAFLNEIDQPSAENLDDLDVDNVCSLLNEIWDDRAAIKIKLAKSKMRLEVMAKSNAMAALKLLQ